MDASRLLGSVVLAAIAMASPLSAGAQPNPSKAAELFDRGKADMLAGRYQKGCPAIASSYQLEPLPPVLFTLAACNAKWGRVATATVQYRTYLAMVERMADALRIKHQRRVAFANERLEQLRPRVPTLSFRLPQGAPSDTEVRRGGELLPPASLSVAIPVDPGEHLVEVSVPGREPSRQKLTIQEGERRVVLLTIPAPAPPPVIQPPAPTASTSLPPPPPAPILSPADAKPTSSVLSSWGYGVGAAGLAALTLGLVMGSVALSHGQTAEEHCPELHCDAEGMAAVDSGQDYALVANIAVGVGVGGVVAGGVLLLLGHNDLPSSSNGRPGNPRPTLSVSADAVAAGLTVHW